LISPFIAGLCAPVVEHLQPLESRGHMLTSSCSSFLSFAENAPLPPAEFKNKG